MRSPVILLVLVLLGVVAWQSFFIVEETELALKFRLGEVIATDFEPGIHLKTPFINNVRKYDRRILSLDSRPQRFLTSERKDVEVDYFVQWRIADVRRFYQSTGGDTFVAGQRIEEVIQNGLRNEFGRRTLSEVVSEQRADVMASLTRLAAEGLAELGVSIVDVRVKKIELPEEVRNSVFERMRAERTRIASDLRAQGREAGERIRADADRQARVLVAEAQRDGVGLRGEGDARAAEIFRAAHGADPEFFAFLRSLEAYASSFAGEGDVLVLDPQSPFFRYFHDSAGNSR